MPKSKEEASFLGLRLGGFRGQYGLADLVGCSFAAVWLSGQYAEDIFHIRYRLRGCDSRSGGSIAQA